MRTAIHGITEKWQWLPQLVARIVIGFVFIHIGLSKLHDLSHTKNVLNFFWIAVPIEHRWDPFFSSVELICGAFMLLGLLTRVDAVLLFGITAASLLNAKLNELTGLNLPASQKFAMMTLLAVLCVTGAGSVALDRLIFKHNTTQTG